MTATVTQIQRLRVLKAATDRQLREGSRFEGASTAGYRIAYSEVHKGESYPYPNNDNLKGSRAHRQVTGYLDRLCDAGYAMRVEDAAGVLRWAVTFQGDKELLRALRSEESALMIRTVDYLIEECLIDEDEARSVHRSMVDAWVKAERDRVAHSDDFAADCLRESKRLIEAGELL